MKKTLCVIAVLLLICGMLSGCYQINTHNQSDYSAFYNKMETVMPATYEMMPAPDAMESIHDIYLFYSDYDLIDSYYTIYLECTFTPEQFEIEKQRLTECAGQYDFSLSDSDQFSYDSVCINQSITSNDDGFIAYQISYALFEAENNKIIYVDAFEEGRSEQLRITNIPDAYLPSDLLSLIE